MEVRAFAFNVRDAHDCGQQSSGRGFRQFAEVLGAQGVGARAGTNAYICTQNTELGLLGWQQQLMAEGCFHSVLVLQVLGEPLQTNLQQRAAARCGAPSHAVDEQAVPLTPAGACPRCPGARAAVRKLNRLRQRVPARSVLALQRRLHFLPRDVPKVGRQRRPGKVTISITGG